MARKSATKPKRKHRLLKLLVLFGAAGGVYSYFKSRRESAAAPDLPPEERLTVKDPDVISGLGTIMQSLIGEFMKSPAKVKLLNGMDVSVAIEPREQPESAVTMEFRGGRALIRPGVVNPDIKISCDLEVLMRMAQMGAGLDAVRYMMTPEGRTIIDKLVSGELKITGVGAHPVGMMKFSRFLAPGG